MIGLHVYKSHLSTISDESNNKDKSNKSIVKLIKKEINSIHGCDGISFSRFTVFNKDVQYLKIGSNYYGNIYLGELHYGYENHFFKHMYIDT